MSFIRDQLWTWVIQPKYLSQNSQTMLTFLFQGFFPPNVSRGRVVKNKQTNKPFNLGRTHFGLNSQHKYMIFNALKISRYRQWHCVNPSVLDCYTICYFYFWISAYYRFYLHMGGKKKHSDSGTDEVVLLCANYVPHRVRVSWNIG